MTQGRHWLTESNSARNVFDRKTAAAVQRILYGERRAVAAMSVLLGATCSEVACLSVPNDRRCDLRVSKTGCERCGRRQAIRMPAECATKKSVVACVGARKGASDPGLLRS